MALKQLKATRGLLCPRCELPLDEHENGCPKRISRRFFLGFLGSAVATAAASKYLANVEIDKQAGTEEVVLAKTKVWEGTLTLRVDSDTLTRSQLKSDIDAIAQREQRPVRGIMGSYIYIADPINVLRGPRA